MKRLFLAIALLLMAQPILALSASIQPPKIILRGEAPGSVDSSINVMNPNNESITVGINATGAIADIIQLSEESVILAANETKKIDFTVNLLEEGNYTGEILFLFTPEEGQGVALSSQIIVLANRSGEVTTVSNGTVVESNWSFLGSLVAILAIVIIVGILIYLWGRRV